MVNADDSMSVSPTVTTTYDLRATGEGGPVTASVTVTVTDPPDPDPEVVSFTASTLTIVQGGSVTLSWVTMGGNSRELRYMLPGGTALILLGSPPASGSTTVTPNVTTTYYMTVWNNVDPSIFDQRQLTVTVTVPAAVVDSFSVSPTNPAADEDFTLELDNDRGNSRPAAKRYRVL